MSRVAAHPVQVHVEAATGERNRLTTAFRIILALPHLVLVGGPVALLSWTWNNETGARQEWGAGGGVFGAAICVVTVIAWFAILFTGRYPEGLRKLTTLYLRWRVRVSAYTALLRDEYPPFGDAPYPAVLDVRHPRAPRNRLTVAFRIVLAIPQIFAVFMLGLVWTVTTVISWFAILFTGRMPRDLGRFAVGSLRWSTRVEAYLLLLHDEYPPFSLD